MKDLPKHILRVFYADRINRSTALESISVNLVPAYSKDNGLINDRPVRFRLGEGAVPFVNQLKRKHTGSPIKAEGYHASPLNLG